MKKISYILLSVLLLFPSCKGIKELRSDYVSDQKVPEHLIGQNQATQNLDTSSSLGDLSWRQLFSDTQLWTLVDEALAVNTDMRLARINVEKMEIALTTAKKSFLPTVAFSPQGTYSSYNSTELKTYSFPLTAQWQVDIFGSLRNKKKQAQALLAQSRDMVQATQCQLVANVTNLYYQLLMLDEELRVLRETEQIRKESVSTQKALMEAGMATSAAVDQMQASYYSVQAQRIDVETQIVQVENALCILLTRTPQHIARGNINDFVFPKQVGIGVPAKLLGNRPDVRVAERNIENAFYMTNEAKAALYPSLTLSGSASWTDSGNGLLVDPGKMLWSALASLTQPIYAQGKLRANIKLSQRQQEEAKLNYVSVMLSAGKDVNDALISCQASLQKYEILKLQVRSLDSAYMATKELMNHGQGTYLEVLMAQESLLSSQLSQIANTYSSIQSIINLYIALGGGTK